jgi:hypothetical protein
MPSKPKEDYGELLLCAQRFFRKIRGIVEAFGEALYEIYSRTVKFIFNPNTILVFNHQTNMNEFILY